MFLFGSLYPKFEWNQRILLSLVSIYIRLPVSKALFFRLFKTLFIGASVYASCCTKRLFISAFSVLCPVPMQGLLSVNRLLLHCWSRKVPLVICHFQVIDGHWSRTPAPKLNTAQIPNNSKYEKLRPWNRGRKDCQSPSIVAAYHVYAAFSFYLHNSFICYASYNLIFLCFYLILPLLTCLSTMCQLYLVLCIYFACVLRVCVWCRW